MTDVPPYVQPPTLVDLAATILSTCGQALDANSIDGFGNRLIAPGGELALDTPGTLAVFLDSPGLHAGKIGTQQFAGMVPGEAAWAQTVAIFKVEIWQKQPVPNPSATSIAGFAGPSAQALTKYANSLLEAGFVIFAALQVAQYKNLLFPFKPALIGPLQPIGPRGDYAGMTLSVQIQMP